MKSQKEKSENEVGIYYYVMRDEMFFFFQRKCLFFFQEKIDILEYELRREVEDLKFRFQMVVDYYKEKFKECQRF